MHWDVDDNLNMIVIEGLWSFKSGACELDRIGWNIFLNWKIWHIIVSNNLDQNYVLCSLTNQLFVIILLCRHSEWTRTEKLHHIVLWNNCILCSCAALWVAERYWVNTSDLVSISGKPLWTWVTKCTTGNLASHWR